MKSGVAVQLKLAAEVTAPVMDVTYVFYDCEEVESERNGLLRLSQEQPGEPGGRLRDPARADRRRGRGRLSGHAPGGRAGQR